MSEVFIIQKEAPLSEAQRQEIASARMELEQALGDMIVAIRNNKSVQGTADGLKSKGWWSAFKGTVSGANDRDLAKMITELGGSLETTQKAVQVMLRLQSRKDHVLREFLSVLVDKIKKIQSDTHTLDTNQQAAVDVLCDFQEQIEDQLRHHEAVVRHESKIAELFAELARRANEIQQGLQVLGDQATSLKGTSEHLATEVDVVRRDLNTHAEFSVRELKTLTRNQQTIEKCLASMEAKGKQDIAALQSAGKNLMELVDSLKNQYSTAADVFGKKLENLTQAEANLTSRTVLIEMQLRMQASLTSWLKRNIVSLLSLTIGGIAFMHSVLRW